MERFLDRLHARARANPALQRLALISRILLGLGFIPTGLVKLLGERFTVLGMDSPVGLFFEAMYRSGGYWNFIGMAQVAAGVLLLIPSTATLGAVLFFPIILNIFVITVSLHFTGTPFITGPMLLASIFLLCWDYDRLKFVLFRSSSRPGGRIRVGRLEASGYGLGVVAGLGVLLWTRGFMGAGVMRVCLGLGLVAAVIVLVAWIREMRPAPARAEAV